MAKKSSSVTAAKVAAGVMFAPVTIAWGVGKAAVSVGKAINKANQAAEKERERQERLAAQEQKRRERAERMAAAEARRAEAERARADRERTKAAKLAAQQKARAEAEQARVRLAYASLEERYQGAFLRHAELLKLMDFATDDLMLIEYCKEDIELIPLMYDYETRRSIMENRQPAYPHFEAYLKLSKAYERLNMYPYAVLACQQAIDMGMTKADAGDSMEQRIEYLRSEARTKGALDNGEV